MGDTMVSPGTTCTFLSSGNVDEEGGFAVEMLCENFNWKVTLTELEWNQYVHMLYHILYHQISRLCDIICEIEANSQG